MQRQIFMHDKLFQPDTVADSGSLRAARVWEVRAEVGYDVRRYVPASPRSLILVRTLFGVGEVSLADGRVLSCAAETVALLAPASIIRYRCVTPLWTFWWFECEGAVDGIFAVDSLLHAPADGRESETLAECARGLERGGADAALASATLLRLCHLWRKLGNEKVQAEKPSSMRIKEIMRTMERTAERPLPVSELARRGRLCEGSFRRVFASVAGMPPKKYYEAQRLAKAVEWLRTSEMKLAEIAERLGYSSAFHLSRAFKKRYGAPPKLFRPS